MVGIGLAAGGADVQLTDNMPEVLALLRANIRSRGNRAPGGPAGILDGRRMCASHHGW